MGSTTPSLTSRIHTVRGQKVMLDADLAQLYGVATKAPIQAVKRNEGRFPLDFVFQLADQEIVALRSQIVTSNAPPVGRGGRRTAPYAFTEQGVAMLSSVLRSGRAVQVNVEIMRAFVRLRDLIGHNRELAKRLDDLESRYDRQFKVVFDAIRELMTPPVPATRRRIGFVATDEDPAGKAQKR
ncbi:MAG: ORF6N domain-containing protein [Burkholderiales bacterium]